MADKVVARAGMWKVIVFALFIAVFLLFISVIPLGVNLSFILFIPEWLFFSVILLFLNKPRGQEYNNEIVEIANAKLTWHENDLGRGWQKDRTEIYWKVRNIEDYLKTKGNNRIIAVMGASRSGKSQLVYKLIQSVKEQKKIIFQFKATDEYTRLGFPVLYVHKAVPNVFVSPEGVARAFITAFPISTSMQGITASTVRGQVKQIAEKSKNWQDFKKILDDLYQHENDSITKGALKFIQNNLPIIYRENVLNYELPDACVLDFEGGENREVDMQFFVFYSEFMLNQLSKEIWNKRQNTLFVIDEAHLLTKSGFSIIPEMSALIGAKGSMILASQRIADLQGQALDNCKTQFTFKQTGKENLDEVRAISDLFHEVVGQMLSTYEFCDIGQDRPDVVIKIFQLVRPQPVYFDVEELKIQAEQKKSKTDNTLDYSKTIVELLSQAGNIQDLAKRIAKIYGGKGDDYRLKIKDIPKKLVKLNEINVELVDYVKFNDKQVFVVNNSTIYFRKNENPSGLHTYIVNMTANVLYHKGISDFKIQPAGIGTADIESGKYVFEIETGLKNDINDLKGRIDFYKKEGKETIIIVPNQEAKQKYKDKYLDVKVLTIPELWESEL
ncbi:MAG: hypothetical protein AMDU5_GPLC00004G0294 [Thermoplasmatales archaeon Gpl]|jgi:hypothetical protein|nr:MAG: hypothetical protein AMDU5_GPLC00004G0294 [Thermoplasmatales archaeon Gpl]